MMNLQWITVILTIVAIQGVKVSAKLHDTEKSHFDNHGMCDNMDWKVIDDMLLAAAASSRADTITDVDTSNEMNHRQLQRIPTRCRTDCAGYASGFCPVPGCSGVKMGQETTLEGGGDTKTGADHEPAPLTSPDHGTRRYLRSKEKRDLQSRCRTACAGYVTGHCLAFGCWGYNQNSEVTPLDDSATTTTTPPPSDGIRRALHNDEHENRDLQSRCKTACAGYVSGHCLAFGCWGYNQNSEFTPLDDSTTKTTTTPPPPSDGIRRALHVDEHENRDLQSRCRTACAGYATGHCLAPGCLGYNQNSEYTPLDDSATTTTTTPPPSDGEHARKLESTSTMQMITAPCMDGVTNHVQQKLDFLIQTNAVSSKCQDLLKQSRHATC
jgi:hypothetical protein